MPRGRRRKVETSEIKVTETKKGRKYGRIKRVKTEPKKPEFVTIESADDRVLECIIDTVPYSGKSIKVKAERERGVREVLEGAGYVLK